MDIYSHVSWEKMLGVKQHYIDGSIQEYIWGADRVCNYIASQIGKI